MKTFSHLCQYLAEFFLEWEMFWTKFVEKIKTYFICNNFFSPENLAIYETMSKNMVEPGGRGTYDVTIWRIPARTRAHTHTQNMQYGLLIAFSRH